MSTGVNHSERSHALLSASGSSRWLNCTPSARLEDQFPDSSSSFAEEGTLAHEIAELKIRSILQEHIHFDEAIDKLRTHELYAEEMEDYTDQYVAYVMELYNAALREDPAALIETEVRIDLTKYIPEGFGSVDNVIISGTTIRVIDLKYGKGIRVSATDNSQLKLYALGALEAYGFLYDIDTVELHIHQPRLDAVSVFEIAADELIAWGQDTVIPRADQAFAGEGEQVPGSWCTFCKAKHRCAVLAKEAEDVAALDYVDPRLLTDEQIEEVYGKADRLIRWLNSLGEHMLSEALSGKVWENYKLVEGRSNRVLTDKEAVIGVLEQEGYSEADYMKKDLQGITTLEKLMGKKAFEALLGELISKPAGKPTLTTRDDKRQELSLTSDFE